MYCAESHVSCHVSPLMTQLGDRHTVRWPSLRIDAISGVCTASGLGHVTRQNPVLVRSGDAAAACRIVFRTVNCEYDQCSHRQLPEPCSRVRTVLRILCANPVVNMCESWSRLHYTIGCGVDCSLFTVSSSITTNKKYDCMTTLARGVLGVLHLLSYYVVWPGQCRAVDRVCSKTVS